VSVPSAPETWPSWEGLIQIMAEAQLCVCVCVYVLLGVSVSLATYTRSMLASKRKDPAGFTDHPPPKIKEAPKRPLKDTPRKATALPTNFYYS
jgi:nitric oxide reductase large subunit